MGTVAAALIRLLYGHSNFTHLNPGAATVGNLYYERKKLQNIFFGEIRT
jgi:hypothetical protein